MDYPITPLADLLAHFRACFSRPEPFALFQHVVVAWLLCLRCRTLSEVWQLTGLGPKAHFDAIYSLFSSSRWDWDELGLILCLLLLDLLAPTGMLSFAVDDTLCHKRGKRIAFGGIFLDPVLSSRSRKTLRFGLNYVVVALIVRLPWRPDRYFALPVLWRVFRKKGEAGHRKKTELAAEMVRILAAAFPTRHFSLVADCAYINKVTLTDLPANVDVTGPISKKAALYLPPSPRAEGQRGAPRKKGLRLPTPAQLLKDPGQLQALADGHAADFAPIAPLNPQGWGVVTHRVCLPRGEKVLRVRILHGVLWYNACKARPVTVAVISDPEGEWRDEALVTTQVGATAEWMISEYGKRWCVEVAFHDSKQYLGLHDPQVRAASSVQRAHPMAWFCLSLTVLWFALNREGVARVRRDRPWYDKAVGDTFTDMLGALRLWLWHQRVFGADGQEPVSREMVEGLLNEMAAVG